MPTAKTIKDYFNIDKVEEFKTDLDMQKFVHTELSKVIDKRTLIDQLIDLWPKCQKKISI